MAKSNPTQVGDLIFPTKASGKDFFRRIRDRYEDGERINSEDHGLLFDLLGIHPEATMKIGCGVAYFTVETDREFRSTRHFMIHRIDGSFTDFSFPACFDGRNVRRDILESLRRAVAEQIVAFREKHFAGSPVSHCPLSGVSITREHYHVDHAPPGKFMVLVENWLSTECLTLEQVEITPPADDQIVAEMTSHAQRTSWSSFHLQNATLRMLSPLGNLSHAKRHPSS